MQLDPAIDALASVRRTVVALEPPGWIGRATEASRISAVLRDQADLLDAGATALGPASPWAPVATASRDVQAGAALLRTAAGATLRRGQRPGELQSVQDAVAAIDRASKTVAVLRRLPALPADPGAFEQVVGDVTHAAGTIPASYHPDSFHVAQAWRGAARDASWLIDNAPAGVRPHWASPSVGDALHELQGDPHHAGSARGFELHAQLHAAAPAAFPEQPIIQLHALYTYDHDMRSIPGGASGWLPAASAVLDDSGGLMAGSADAATRVRRSGIPVAAYVAELPQAVTPVLDAISNDLDVATRLARKVGDVALPALRRREAAGAAASVLEQALDGIVQVRVHPTGDGGALDVAMTNLDSLRERLLQTRSSLQTVAKGASSEAQYPQQAELGRMRSDWDVARATLEMHVDAATGAALPATI